MHLDSSSCVSGFQCGALGFHFGGSFFFFFFKMFFFLTFWKCLIIHSSIHLCLSWFFIIYLFILLFWSKLDWKSEGFRFWFWCMFDNFCVLKGRFCLILLSSFGLSALFSFFLSSPSLCGVELLKKCVSGCGVFDIFRVMWSGFCFLSLVVRFCSSLTLLLYFWLVALYMYFAGTPKKFGLDFVDFPYFPWFFQDLAFYRQLNL